MKIYRLIFTTCLLLFSVTNSTYDCGNNRRRLTSNDCDDRRRLLLSDGRKLTGDDCCVPTSTPFPTSKPTSIATASPTTGCGMCNAVMDIVIMLDKSGSIKESNWNNFIVPAVESIINSFDVGSNKIHIGIVSFSVAGR